MYSAFSVGEAEALFDAVRPDLIISDVNLPDKSGLDFVRISGKRATYICCF